MYYNNNNYYYYNCCYYKKINNKRWKQRLKWLGLKLRLRGRGKSVRKSDDIKALQGNGNALTEERWLAMVIAYGSETAS